MFDKDGTLVDFQATWFAVGDALALRAAGGDRARADALLESAGYDFERQCFRGDSVFAAGTNADIVALWYPDSDGEARKALVAEFDGVTAETGAARSVALPGSLEALAALHRVRLPARPGDQRFDQRCGEDLAGAGRRAAVRRRLRL